MNEKTRIIAFILLLLMACSENAVRTATSHGISIPEPEKDRMNTLAPKQIQSVPAEALQAFHQTMTLRNVNLSLYTLSLFENDDSFIILATSKEKKSGLRGSGSGWHDYEVEVTRGEYVVKRVSIAR